MARPLLFFLVILFLSPSFLGDVYGEDKATVSAITDYLDKKDAEILRLKNEIVLEPDSFPLHMELTGVYRDAGFLVLAAQTAERALFLKPSDSEALVLAGTVSLETAKYARTPEQKTVSLEKAKKIFDRYIELKNNGESLRRVGNSYFDNEFLSEAKVYYRRALLLSPDLPNIYLNLARIARAVGDIPFAIDLMKRETQINAQNPDAQLELGMLYLSMGNTELAEKAFRKTINLDLDNQSAYFGLGQVQHILGQYEKALQSFSFVEEGDEPLQIASCFQKGILHEKLLQKEAAIREFTHYVQKSHNKKEVLKAVEVLRRLMPEGSAIPEPKAFLEIESNLAKFTLTINEKKIGNIPNQLEVKPGDYLLINASSIGYRPLVFFLELEPNETKYLFLDFKPNAN